MYLNLTGLTRPQMQEFLSEVQMNTEQVKDAVLKSHSDGETWIVIQLHTDGVDGVSDLTIELYGKYCNIVRETIQNNRTPSSDNSSTTGGKAPRTTPEYYNRTGLVGAGKS